MNRILLRNVPILEENLLNNKNQRTYRRSLFWGCLNFFLLIALLYDVWYSCPLSISYYQYIEYIFTVILLLNFIYHVCKVIQTSFYLSNVEILRKNQQKIVQNTDRKISNISESFNYSLSSPSWVYQKGPNISNETKNRSTLNNSNYYQLNSTSSIDWISDENSLDKYLKEYDENTKINNTKIVQKTPTNLLLNSFWSHPITKTAKDMTSFLTKCQYQLSTQSSMKNQNSPGRDDTNKSIINQQETMDIWTKINVNIVVLTQWNENLRMWISKTILERLVDEFQRIDDALEKQCFVDMKLGQVGLDRIRKTAQILTNNMPSLMQICPFLEITTNQMYLVKRIKELAKGGCISEFKWNGGGKEWEDSLPTDSEIIMHLFASYLDTQLMPMPNQPDLKPFTGRHFVKLNDKLPTLTTKSLYIQQMVEKPPHYRVIVGEKMYEIVNGYNNLFHTLLFFIYHANRVQNGMLGRVNMGRAGINLLWVIDE